MLSDIVVSDLTDWYRLVRTPLDEWSVRRKELYLTSYNTHKGQIFMPPGGIQTRNLGKWTVADPRLRPRGDRDGQYDIRAMFILCHSAPRKEPRYPLNRRLDGLQRRPGPFGEGAVFFCSCWDRNTRIVQPFA